jgi:hypothetical protein
MKKKIAYNDNEGLKIIHPAIDLDIDTIAHKDVPSGLYFKIIDESDLPSRETRQAWEIEIDSENADGIGLTKEEFEAKYPEYKGMAVQ